ncbi:MAG: class II glutamine amidotransferase, partial [Wenzhouxiangellaceae bacterium]|nr:class II glutamine amidotransferase [Wenzhouxiangellaceae bacterium]
MCRFTFYMGDNIAVADLVTRPENSLIHQSAHAKERPEPLNGDGFGLAWYVPDDPKPARFRSLTPAWSNANLAELAR